MIIYHAVERLK